jgi:phosphoribosyl-ATP pyrophosphohydrolase
MSDSIERLHAAILKERKKSASASRTAKLLGEGTAKIAKKLAEEAVEVGHEAILGNRETTIAESADVLYNLAVLWADSGIKPADVWAEMARREMMMGIAGKLPKSGAQVRNRPVPRQEPDAPASPEPGWSLRETVRRLRSGYNRTNSRT